MYNQSFIDACLSGDATIFELDNYINYWHENETGNTLQEFLGLTDYECESWGKSNDAVFRDILRCRQENIRFEDYRIMTTSERKAARSYDADAIERMKKDE